MDVLNGYEHVPLVGRLRLSSSLDRHLSFKVTVDPGQVLEKVG